MKTIDGRSLESIFKDTRYPFYVRFYTNFIGVTAFYGNAMIVLIRPVDMEMSKYLTEKLSNICTFVRSSTSDAMGLYITKEPIESLESIFDLIDQIEGARPWSYAIGKGTIQR